MPHPMIAARRRPPRPRPTTPAVRTAIALLIDHAVRYGGHVVSVDVLPDLLVVCPTSDRYDLGDGVHHLIASGVITPDGYGPSGHRRWWTNMRRAVVCLNRLMGAEGCTTEEMDERLWRAGKGLDVDD